MYITQMSREDHHAKKQDFFTNLAPKQKKRVTYNTTIYSFLYIRKNVTKYAILIIFTLKSEDDSNNI